MRLMSVAELWNFALALAKELDKEALFEANQLALQASPVFKARLKRLKDQIRELADAGGSRRDALALVPHPWRQDGFSFPASEKECELVARTQGIMLNFALRKILHTSRQELDPLVAEAFRRKQDTFDKYAETVNKYYQPAGEWFCRHVNHNAAALADFYFGQLRRGRIPLVELITLNLEQVGLEGARKAIDEVVKEEDSLYSTLMKAYREEVVGLAARTELSSPSATAELIVAHCERLIKYEATFYKDLTQRDSKLRRAITAGVTSSMRDYCRKRSAELERFFDAIECRNELRRSEIDFDPSKALALDIILTYKRRKVEAIRRREPYEKLSVLCEEAGADYEYVQAFAVKLGLLPKRGRPRK